MKQIFTGQAFIDRQIRHLAAHLPGVDAERFLTVAYGAMCIADVAAGRSEMGSVDPSLLHADAEESPVVAVYDELARIEGRLLSSDLSAVYMAMGPGSLLSLFGYASAAELTSAKLNRVMYKPWDLSAQAIAWFASLYGAPGPAEVLTSRRVRVVGSPIARDALLDVIDTWGDAFSHIQLRPHHAGGAVWDIGDITLPIEYHIFLPMSQSHIESIDKGLIVDLAAMKGFSIASGMRVKGEGVVPMIVNTPSGYVSHQVVTARHI